MRIITLTTEAGYVPASLKHIGEPATPCRIASSRGAARVVRGGLGRMPSLPRQVPPSIPAPSPRRRMSMFSGCTCKATSAGLLGQSLPLSANTPIAQGKIRLRPRAGRFRPHRLPTPPLKRGFLFGLDRPLVQGDRTVSATGFLFFGLHAIDQRTVHTGR